MQQKICNMKQGSSGREKEKRHPSVQTERISEAKGGKRELKREILRWRDVERENREQPCV